MNIKHDYKIRKAIATLFAIKDRHPDEKSVICVLENNLLQGTVSFIKDVIYMC